MKKKKKKYLEHSDQLQESIGGKYQLLQRERKGKGLNHRV